KSAAFRDHALGIKRARMIYPSDAHKAIIRVRTMKKSLKKLPRRVAVCRNTLGNQYGYVTIMLRDAGDGDVGSSACFARSRGLVVSSRVDWRGSSYPLKLSAGRYRAPPSTDGPPEASQISRLCPLCYAGQVPSSDMAWIPSGLSKAPCCTWLAERDPHPRSRNWP